VAKYLVLYNSDLSASELMEKATPEQMKASMAEWMAWAEKANKTVKFEFGMPLQAVNKITLKGVEKADTNVSGHSFMEGGSKEEISELLTSHPHLKREGATIDLLEVLPMPGIKEA
jgi:hypothetical protein